MICVWPGLCNPHYRRALNDRGILCSVEGCAGPRYSLGLCVLHYSRLKDKGEVGPVERLIAPSGDGSVEANGYRVLFRPDHEIARAQGKVYEHRAVLFGKIGEGPHPCHWCGILVGWDRAPGIEKLIADHLDDDRLNNDPENLVPACIPCNTHRPSLVR